MSEIEKFRMEIFPLSEEKTCIRVTKYTRELIGSVAVDTLEFINSIDPNIKGETKGVGVLSLHDTAEFKKLILSISKHTTNEMNVVSFLIHDEEIAFAGICADPVCMNTMLEYIVNEEIVELYLEPPIKTDKKMTIKGIKRHAHTTFMPANFDTLCLSDKDIRFVKTEKDNDGVEKNLSYHTSYINGNINTSLSTIFVPVLGIGEPKIMVETICRGYGGKNIEIHSEGTIREEQTERDEMRDVSVDVIDVLKYTRVPYQYDELSDENKVILKNIKKLNHGVFLAKKSLSRIRRLANLMFKLQGDKQTDIMLAEITFRDLQDILIIDLFSTAEIFGKHLITDALSEEEKKFIRYIRQVRNGNIGHNSEKKMESFVDDKDVIASIELLLHKIKKHLRKLEIDEISKFIENMEK